nr:hypothetical protein [Tanacetum cinerariifolium]
MAYKTSKSSSSSSSDSEYVEERLVHYKKNEDVLTDQIDALNFDVQLRDKVLAEYTKKLEKAEKERDELKLILEKLQNSSKSLNALLESQTVKTIDVKGMVSKEEPNPVKKNRFSPPIIEDWVSESEEEYEPKFQKQVQPSFPKIKFVKAKDQNQSFRKLVKQVEQAKSNTYRPKGN